MKKVNRLAQWIALFIIGVPLLVFLVMGLYLSDSSINGFIGMWAVMAMRDGETCVELTQEPHQLMIHLADAENTFEDTYFDSWHQGDALTKGSGIKDGQLYTYSLRSFTREFYIVTLEPVTD